MKPICLQIHDRPVRDGARRRDIPREHKRRAGGGRRRVQVLGGEPGREGASRRPAQHLRTTPCACDGKLRRRGGRDDRHQVSRRGLPDRQHRLGERFANHMPFPSDPVSPMPQETGRDVLFFQKIHASSINRNTVDGDHRDSLLV